MDTINWGIIGIGRFGRIHARVISQMPNSRLVAFANRNQQRLSEAASEFETAKAYSNFHDLLQDPEVDAVSITTHWKDHFEVAIAALVSGKHVLLEKPMAATSSECEKLLSAAEKADLCFLVGHICRFDTRVTLAKQAIDEGRIGRIVSIHAKRNLPKAPGNIRLDKISPLIGDGIHDIDLMMWFLNRAPSSVYARNVKFSDFKYPDLGWAMLHFDDEAIGVVETVWCLPESVPTAIDAQMEVIGTEGKISIDCANTGLTITDQSGSTKPDTVYWPEQYGQQVGALEREIAYLNSCIEKGEMPTIITPREAARALAVVEAAELSAESGVPVAIEVQ